MADLTLENLRLKAQRPTVSPSYQALDAVDQFHTKTMRMSPLWRCNVTYFKIIACKLCANMRGRGCNG